MISRECKYKIFKKWIFK